MHSQSTAVVCGYSTSALRENLSSVCFLLCLCNLRKIFMHFYNSAQIYRGVHYECMVVISHSVYKCKCFIYFIFWEQQSNLSRMPCLVICLVHMVCCPTCQQSKQISPGVQQVTTAEKTAHTHPCCRTTFFSCEVPYWLFTTVFAVSFMLVLELEGY